MNTTLRNVAANAALGALVAVVATTTAACGHHAEKLERLDLQGQNSGSGDAQDDDDKRKPNRWQDRLGDQKRERSRELDDADEAAQTPFPTSQDDIPALFPPDTWPEDASERAVVRLIEALMTQHNVNEKHIEGLVNGTVQITSPSFNAFREWNSRAQILAQKRYRQGEISAADLETFMGYHTDATKETLEAQFEVGDDLAWVTVRTNIVDATTPLGIKTHVNIGPETARLFQDYTETQPGTQESHFRGLLSPLFDGESPSNAIELRVLNDYRIRVSDDGIDYGMEGSSPTATVDVEYTRVVDGHTMTTEVSVYGLEIQNIPGVN